MNNLPRIGVPLLIILTFGLLIVAKSFVTIGSGEAGVLYKLFGGGVVTDEPPLDEGFHLFYHGIVYTFMRLDNKKFLKK